MEEEFLEEFSRALDWYEKAFRILEENSIHKEGLHNKFKNAYEQAKVTIKTYLYLLTLRKKRKVNVNVHKPRPPSSNINNMARKISKSPNRIMRPLQPSVKSMAQAPLSARTAREDRSPLRPPSRPISRPKLDNSLLLQNNRIICLTSRDSVVPPG